MKLKAIQTSIQRASNEILTITKQLIKHKPTSRNDVRQVLLQTTQAHNVNQYNQIAVNILKLDKELNLLQYHGFTKYLSNHISTLSLPSPMLLFQRTSQSSTDSDHVSSSLTKSHGTSESTSTGNLNLTDKKTKAKVAFMITAQQRQLLMSEYNYTQDQIKSMKPHEAQIIFQHEIRALDENDSSWRDVVEKKLLLIEEQSDVENKRIEEGHSNENESMSKNVNILSIGFEERLERHDEGSKAQIMTSAIQPIGNETKVQNEPLLKENENLLESLQNDHDSEDQDISDDGKCWFEVIKVTSSSEEAIALYKTLEEAEELLEIKRDLAKKKVGKSSSFSYEYKEELLIIRKRKV